MVFARKLQIEGKATDFFENNHLQNKNYYIKEFMDSIGRVLQLSEEESLQLF